MQKTVFSLGAVRVEVTLPPLRRAGDRTSTLHQRRERDSSGSPYIYTKSLAPRRTYPLRLVLSANELDLLRAFFRDTVGGVRRAFTWTDHQGTERQVRLVKSARRHQQEKPGRFVMDIDLEEGP